MQNGNFRYYEFGGFRLDTRRRILTKEDKKFRLTPRNFDLLLTLIENEGRVLAHDELLDKVWEGMFVEQSNLKKGVSALRQILGESPDAAEFIKTIPGRGYSFVAPVRALPDDSAEKFYARETIAEITIEEEIEEADLIEISAPESIQRPLPAVQIESLFTKISRHKIAVAVFVILAFGAALFGVKSYFSSRLILFSAENVSITKATSEGNLYGTFVSPDGNYIVYVVAERDGRSLRVKHLATGSITQLVKLANAGFWTAAFSPDGNYVYYGMENFDDRSASGLYRTPFLGGEPRRLFEDAAANLTFAPDGSRLAFTRQIENLDVEIVTANIDGGDEQCSISYSPETRVDGLNWSPDALGLLIALRKRLSAEKVVSYVSEISLADGREKVIVPEQEKQIASAIWLPGKSNLLMSIRDANAEIYRIWQYFPASGEWRRVVNDDNSYRILSLTRDGKTLVSTREMRVASIWLAENGQSDFRQITDGAGGYDRLTWTRNGRIVYDSPEAATAAFWIMDADGAHKKQLSDGKDGIRLFPKTSGDGNSIIFNSYRSGTRQIWRIGLDSDNLTQLTDVETGASGGALLSDNQTLVYSSYIKPNGWTIFKRTADGNTVPLSTEDTNVWSISPDEHFIAYSAMDEKTKKQQVFVRSLDDGELIKTFDFEPKQELRWTRDGKALAYLAEKDDTDQIIIQPLDGSAAKTLVSFRSEEIFWFDWSFDGTKLAVVRGKQLADAVIIKAEVEK